MISRDFFYKLRVNGHLLGKVISLGWSTKIWSNSPKKSDMGHYPTFFCNARILRAPGQSILPTNDWSEDKQHLQCFQLTILTAKVYPIQVSKIAQSTKLVGDGQGKTMTGIPTIGFEHEIW